MKPMKQVRLLENVKKRQLSLTGLILRTGEPISVLFGKHFLVPKWMQAFGW